MAVIDASALLKVVLAEDHAPAFQEWYAAELASGTPFVAPSVLPYELAHALWRRVPAAHQRGASWTRDIVRDLLLPIEVDADAWARVDPWRSRMSAYDAAYLALAVAREAPLVTYDARLAAAAHDAGVAVVRPVA